MVKTQPPQTTAGVAPETSRFRRRTARLVAAGAIVAGTLAVAGPSWAGPMMGC